MVYFKLRVLDDQPPTEVEWQVASSSTGRVSASGAAAGFGSGGVRSGKSSCSISEICNILTGALKTAIAIGILIVRHEDASHFGHDAKYSPAPRR
jgi:hypothetical protein